ncbi:hypothetical protein PE066_15465 [Ramlibacter tataouinensis]|uniref:hypothetical protein n=1 Tax=Ramlibacter tataouinensis TaxID=94132 RepID=UPI0022F3DE77|nr:hypothetical protein [Ramlibacter tataouinensis]WBY00850.1 hypothetical protein PE066_15465 [Ramlibacter tataouinensis]
MGLIDFLVHLTSFLAPALFLGLALPLASRLLLPGRGRFWLQAGLVALAAAAVLAGGLWWFGRDGKMATYAAAVLAAASTQWLLSRAWK